MQYTFLGFSQEQLIALGLDDRDAALLRYFVDFKDTDEMYSEQHDGDTYYWLKYESIRKELPILGNQMQKDAIYRRFRHMAEIGVLKHYYKKSGGSFSFYTIGPKYFQLISSSELPKQSELPLQPSGSKTVPSDPKAGGSGNKIEPSGFKTGGSDFTTGAPPVLEPEGYGSKTGAKDQSTKDQSTKKIRESEDAPALALFVEKFPSVALSKRRRQDLIETVTNLDAWKLTVWWWELKGYRAEHTENMLDYYTTKALPRLAARASAATPGKNGGNGHGHAAPEPADSPWAQILQRLQRRINAPSFNTWLRPVAATLTDHTIALAVPDDVFEYWLREHYLDVIQDEAQQVLGFPPQMTFVCEAVAA